MRPLSFLWSVLGSHAFVVVLMMMASLGIVLQHRSNSSSSAVGAFAFDSEQKQCLCESEPSKYLIKLHEPWRHFDSNHWFHVAEYYLSRHRFVDARMPRNASLYIMTSDPSFAGGLTAVTFFLMQMSFTDGTSNRIDVFSPSTLQWQNPTARSFRSNGPVITYDGTLPINERYVRHDHQWSMEQQEQCYCGRYLGEFGSAPIDRGFWFNGPKDVEHMRKKVTRICADSRDVVKGTEAFYYQWLPSEELSEEARQQQQGPKHPDLRQKRKPFKLVAYQRDASRKFLEFDSLLGRLYDKLGDKWEFQVILHRDDMMPCLLYTALKDADIFLTTHGFQSTSALFMKEGSVLFECFPYKYWKEGYQHLAWEYGLHHRWIQQPHALSWDRTLSLTFIPQSVCMKNIRCRSYARGDDVKLTEEQVTDVIETARKIVSGELSAANTYLRDPQRRKDRKTQPS